MQGQHIFAPAAVALSGFAPQLAHCARATPVAATTKRLECAGRLIHVRERNPFFLVKIYYVSTSFPLLFWQRHRAAASALFEWRCLADGAARRPYLFPRLGKSAALLFQGWEKQLPACVGGE
jgi:hypothetical protein